MAVDQWLQAPFTRDPVRRRTYPDDVYFREMAALLDGRDARDNERTLGRTTFVMFKPDAVVGRRIEPALDLLAGHGFEPLGALEVRVDARVCRELWRYQINAAPLAVIRAVDMILESGPPCLFVALYDTHGPQRTGGTAAERLGELKGSSKNRDTGGTSLRGALGCELMCLNFLHAPDDAADLIREMGVLLPARRREGAWAMLEGEPSPGRTLDVVAAARRLCAAHPALPLTPPPGSTSPASTDSMELLARVEELAEDHGGLPLWDRIVLAAQLVDGLPSEGTALIGPPPGTRLNHPRTARSTNAAPVAQGTKNSTTAEPPAHVTTPAASVAADQ
ncbi:nucleoside-diphosphate kinase [Streptomyces sp. NRRL B-24085]|uniref:nucleoside-diphosphate kinase n=1 Tax=Streptomyces sp. NRRL B-24085 TaxID=1709476 RepID=UPI0006B34509|nr:nucleoside-diphosphate kinase [Streptomyces sp. NRRL B-24085]